MLEVVHPLVVAVPVALEELVLVVLALEPEEIAELREAGVDLVAQRVAVIRRVVAAAVLDGEVEQAAELVARADEAGAGVLGVHREAHAGVGLARPREEALGVG